MGSYPYETHYGLAVGGELLGSEDMAGEGDDRDPRSPDPAMVLYQAFRGDAVAVARHEEGGQSDHVEDTGDVEVLQLAVGYHVVGSAESAEDIVGFLVRCVDRPFPVLGKVEQVA